MQGIEHYENFPVASWLCPARLRPAILALYHFARTADDLADEGDASAQTRLMQLAQYREDLHTCWTWAQAATPPSLDKAKLSQAWPQVFDQLASVIAQHQLPLPLLTDLLDAFVQDVVYTRDGRRYDTQVHLLDYCQRSANPVGRLLLHLYGIKREQALQQSDAICSALQLINFWQDRAQDLQRGRDYLPIDSVWTDQLRFARDLMLQGAQLVHEVPGRAGWELRLVVQGGLRILQKLENDPAQHDPATDPSKFKRPTLKPADVVIMLWRAMWM